VKTEVGSFRLDKDVMSKLKKEAKNENISLNSLVNKVLDRHVGWYSAVGMLGLVPISPNALADLFKNMSEDDIKKLAKKQVPLISENVLLLKHEDTLEGYLNLVKEYFTMCGFPLTVREKNGNITFTIQHSIGKKYSLYVEEIMRGRIENLTKDRAEISSTTNTITFSVKE